MGGYQRVKLYLGSLDLKSYRQLWSTTTRSKMSALKLEQWASLDIRHKLITRTPRYGKSENFTTE